MPSVRRSIPLLAIALAACEVPAFEYPPDAAVPADRPDAGSELDAGPGEVPACDPGPRGSGEDHGPYDAVAIGSGLAAPDGAAVVMALGTLGHTDLAPLVVTRVRGGAFAAWAKDVIEERYDYPRVVTWIDLSGDGKCAAGEMWERQYYGIAWDEHVCVEGGDLSAIGEVVPAESDQSAELCAALEGIVRG